MRIVISTQSPVSFQSIHLWILFITTKPINGHFCCCCQLNFKCFECERWVIRNVSFSTELLATISFSVIIHKKHNFLSYLKQNRKYGVYSELFKRKLLLKNLFQSQRSFMLNFIISLNISNSKFNECFLAYKIQNFCSIFGWICFHRTIWAKCTFLRKFKIRKRLSVQNIHHSWI